MAVQFGLLIVVAYFLGSVPLAFLIAKWARGIDLRRYGSGNVGMSNLAKFTSKRFIIPVIIFDVGKGMIMVWAAWFLGLEQYRQVIVGVAAIIGHNWPAFLHFSGGRGILTTLGVVLILPAINLMVPWEAIIALAITASGLFVFHNLPLGVIIGVASLPLVGWGFSKPFPFIMGFLAIFVITVVRRLAVSRAAIAGSLGWRELLINRLLLDRDIKDAEAWVTRVPAGASSTVRSPMKQRKQRKG
jgi:glycerol-3-phosphate acyltransferase PlsY